MNKDELDAQVLYADLRRKEALLMEFEHLRPNWKGSIIRFVSSLAAMLFLIWYYPDILDQPILYVLLILIFSVGAEVHSESKKLNKRMDVLYRLLKESDK